MDGNTKTGHVGHLVCSGAYETLLVWGIWSTSQFLAQGLQEGLLIFNIPYTKDPQASILTREYIFVIDFRLVSSKSDIFTVINLFLYNY